MDYNSFFLRSISSVSLLIFFFLIVNFFETFIPFIILIIYGILLYEVYFSFRKNTKVYVFLLIYIIFSLLCIEIYLYYFYKKIFFIYFVLIISCFDTISFVSGTLFGKKQILPNISPNKTIFGFVFGFISTVIISLIFNYYFTLYDFFKAISFFIIIILSAFIGDIIESYFKRSVKIKDSGNLLPGHGGLFDRLDSFVFGSIIILFFVYLYG